MRLASQSLPPYQAGADYINRKPKSSRLCVIYEAEVTRLCDIYDAEVTRQQKCPQLEANECYYGPKT